jgi:hypothetical protein
MERISTDLIDMLDDTSKVAVSDDEDDYNL